MNRIGVNFSTVLENSTIAVWRGFEVVDYVNVVILHHDATLL